MLALLYAEHFAGDILDGGHDGVAVQTRAPRENLKDEQVEGALQRVGFGHTQNSNYIDV